MKDQALIQLLSTRFNAHTILLYGSRARGDATEQSDWDVTCVAPVKEARHYGTLEDNTFLDVFVYPALDAPSPDDLRMLGSRILKDDLGLAQPYLASLAALDARGPLPMPNHQREMERTWITKMVERARRDDLEACYRRHWLLKDLLEYAFTLRNQWFRGPKAALKVLAQENPHLHSLFAAALQPGAPFSSIERLAAAVRELTPQCGSPPG